MGTSYGIVPYVNPPATGSIAGIVGAGGNSGAVGFGMGFRQLDYKDAFYLMGFTILGSSVLSLFINIKGSSTLICGGTDENLNSEQKISSLEVPEYSPEAPAAAPVKASAPAPVAAYESDDDGSIEA